METIFVWLIGISAAAYLLRRGIRSINNKARCCEHCVCRREKCSDKS